MRWSDCARPGARPVSGTGRIIRERDPHNTYPAHAAQAEPCGRRHETITRPAHALMKRFRKVAMRTRGIEQLNVIADTSYNFFERSALRPRNLLLERSVSIPAYNSNVLLRKLEVKRPKARRD